MVLVFALRKLSADFFKIRTPICLSVYPFKTIYTIFCDSTLKGVTLLTAFCTKQVQYLSACLNVML